MASHCMVRQTRWRVTCMMACLLAMGAPILFCVWRKQLGTSHANTHLYSCYVICGHKQSKFTCISNRCMQGYLERIHKLRHKLRILLNVMFHARMGRFQLELIYFITYFSTVVPFIRCVLLSCRPFGFNAIFSAGLVRC